jgi:hypothetical protein
MVDLSIAFCMFTRGYTIIPCGFRLKKTIGPEVLTAQLRTVNSQLTSTTDSIVAWLKKCWDLAPAVIKHGWAKQWKSSINGWKVSQ